MAFDYGTDWQLDFIIESNYQEVPRSFGLDWILQMPLRKIRLKCLELAMVLIRPSHGDYYGYFYDNEFACHLSESCVAGMVTGNAKMKQNKIMLI